MTRSSLTHAGSVLAGPAPTIVEFCVDPQLLGLALSPAQRTLLKAIYGLPLGAGELDLWRLCADRATYPGRRFAEVTVIAGARSGKDSRVAAPVVLYEALFGGHRVAKGETTVVPLIAQDADAAGIAFQYIRSYLLGSPLLAPLLDGEPLARSLRLQGGIEVRCFACTQRSVRGYGIPAAVMDELGFYRLEGAANSDAEVQASIRRGMLNFPARLLVKISTAYMRSGVLYEDFRRAFAQDDADLLVWRAPTSLMNPTITPEALERERRLDPVRFAREYLGEFAEDLESFLTDAEVDGAVVPGRLELPYRAGVRYVFACDPSGGGADAFTLAGCHPEGEGARRRVVQDVMLAHAPRGGEPVDLTDVVAEYAAVAKRYGRHELYGDRYGGQWVREAFRAHGVTYRDAALRDQSGEEKYLDKSSAFLEVRPLFATRAIDLLDHPALVRELKNLERRPQAGGKDRVDHPRGGHDDHANALALAAAKCRQGHAVPVAGALAALAPTSTPEIPPHIQQIGEPAPTAGVGWVRPRPAAGLVGGQGQWIRRRYE